MIALLFFRLDSCKPEARQEAASKKANDTKPGRGSDSLADCRRRGRVFCCTKRPPADSLIFCFSYGQSQKDVIEFPQ